MLYQTHARVHLGNIRANLEAIRQRVGPDRKILMAVKANGYGHGSVEVARMIAATGAADWLGVATVPSGIRLREAGIGLPILKFSVTFPEEMPAALEQGLTLAVCDPDNADALEAAAGLVGSKASVHLKVDTGMGRIGVDPAEALDLARHLVRSCPNLSLDGVFTHLPVSDEADPGWTREQVARFRGLVDGIQDVVGRRILAHSSNSGAVLGHPEAWLDMVRPGIMAYGFYPDAGTPRTVDLLPGLSFQTRVSFLKKVAAGTSIGYGRTWVAPEATWIATIPAGYADGFNRLFSNRGRVLIDGRSYPIVGRVCMDQSMVNLGPETSVKVGDTVVLLGRSGEEEISAYEWAEKLGTITYEVTCQINGRVERVYDGY
ncbi:MAG TPA: alanine racemase [Holophaga sp.]|nr:alanine racemase [Holophaga sp.]